eukprot:1068753-Rhodomonas_salina.1
MEAARREAEQDKHSRDSAARSAAQHLALLQHKSPPTLTPLSLDRCFVRPSARSTAWSGGGGLLTVRRGGQLGGAHEQLAEKEAEVVAKGRGLIDAKTALARKEAELVAKGRELTDAKRALEQAKAEVQAANTRLKDQHEHASAIQRRLVSPPLLGSLSRSSSGAAQSGACCAVQQTPAREASEGGGGDGRRRGQEEAEGAEAQRR